ncbi:MAG TPA: hypothetical protein VKX17_28680 [Planctomycetota bacterium]|nr:hypothetical protein [Planctomycetota bacterium]
MPEPPRRWRFQIHLSTAVVMMFVAGGLIWANNTTRVLYLQVTPTQSYSTDGVHGWPFSVVDSVRSEYIREYLPEGETVALNRDYYPRHIAIALNLFIGLMICCLAWYLCELVAIKFAGLSLFIATVVLICANIRDRELWTYTAIWHIYGWPMDAVAATTLDTGNKGNFVFRYFGIGIDLIVAIGILVVVRLLCEWLIRRCAARKKD